MKLPAPPRPPAAAPSTEPGRRTHAASQFRKDVSLVHMHAGDINLVPRKLMSALICLAQGRRATRYTCEVRDVLTEIGYTSRDLHYFLQALDYLMLSKFEWNILDAQGDSVKGASTFLASYQLINNRTIEFTFSDHLLDRIFNPTMFAVFEMSKIRPFGRVSGLSLYETCKRYVDIGQTPWQDLHIWRKVLAATSPIYDTTARLMDKIIKPAIAEVNKVSDITIALDPRRENRVITHIRFLISPKPQQVIPLESSFDPVQNELHDILVNDFGISEPVAMRYVMAYPEDYIRGNIAVVHMAAEKGSVNNVPGFLVRALENDYRKKDTFADRTKRDAREKKAKASAQQMQESALKTEVRRLSEITVWNYVGTLDPAQRTALFHEFTTAKPFMYQYTRKHRDAFSANGTIESSPMVKAALTEFIEAHPDYQTCRTPLQAQGGA